MTPLYPLGAQEVISRLFNAYSDARSHTRSFISALTGLIFYGGWAYFVHYDYGNIVALKAFCTQGLVSFTITLVLTQSMELLYKRFNSPKIAYWCTAVTISLLVILFSMTINIIVGTPKVLMTILPGSIISAIYTFSYVRLLSHIKKEED